MVPGGTIIWAAWAQLVYWHLDVDCPITVQTIKLKKKHVKTKTLKTLKKKYK